MHKNLRNVTIKIIKIRGKGKIILSSVIKEYNPCYHAIFLFKVVHPSLTNEAYIISKLVQFHK